MTGRHLIMGVVLGLAAAGSWASQDDRSAVHTLSFSPPSGTQCELSQVDERISYLGMNEAPVSTERLEREVDCQMSRDEAGWAVTMKLTGYRFVKNGEEAENPLMEALQAHPLTLFLDAGGHAREVRGQDAVVQALKADGVPAEGPLSEKSFGARLLGEWESRIGQFLGQPLVPGATVEQTEPGESGYTTRVTYRWVEACGQAGCIQVDQSFESDLSAVIDAMKPALVSLVQEASRGQIDDLSGRDARLTGQAVRLLDAQTGLILQERIERETHLVIEAEGKPPAPVRLLEIQSRDYDYTFPEAEPVATVAK
ncbi:MAG: hypothetical protein D6758_05380 [Gammaproteobacteria bacterium]|nr:MAG: hypothetical protein D6758_05380 [Gammaproteobacteria bacterium]